GIVPRWDAPSFGSSRKHSVGEKSFLRTASAMTFMSMPVRADAAEYRLANKIVIRAWNRTPKDSVVEKDDGGAVHKCHRTSSRVYPRDECILAKARLKLVSWERARAREIQ